MAATWLPDRWLPDRWLPDHWLPEGSAPPSGVDPGRHPDPDRTSFAAGLEPDFTVFAPL